MTTELYGVGGAVCAAPGTCTTCGRSGELHLEAVRAASSQNNRVDGFCPPCWQLLCARRAWSCANPQVADELRGLEHDLWQAQEYADKGDLGSTSEDRLQAAQSAGELREKIRSLQSRAGYPRSSDGPAVCCYCGGVNVDVPTGTPHVCTHCGETFYAGAE